MKKNKVVYKAIPPKAIKVNIPDTRQIKDFTCGASSLQAVCGYFGVGPDEEEYYVKDMKMGYSGADPEHIIRAATKYGLKYLEIIRMTIKELKFYLDEGKPIIIMIQAWKEFSRTIYKNDWNDGHWVVAIGYDKTGIYFEDPSLAAIRGYLPNKLLLERWHDVEGKKNRHLEQYGVVIWKPRQKRPSYVSRARIIE